MAEWSIAAVLKTVEGNTSGGSNPSLSANQVIKTAVNQKFTAVLILYTYRNPYNLQAESRHIQRWWYHEKSGLRKSVQ